LRCSAIALISHAGSVLLASLVLAPTVPVAFGGRGLAFAVTLVAIQVGRIVFILVGLGRAPAHAEPPASARVDPALERAVVGGRRCSRRAASSALADRFGGGLHRADARLRDTAPRPVAHARMDDRPRLSSGALSAVRDHHLRGVDRENRHEVLCDQCALERCVAEGEIAAALPTGTVAGVRVGCFP
jgi:hypothetical protein